MIQHTTIVTYRTLLAHARNRQQITSVLTHYYTFERLKYNCNVRLTTICLTWTIPATVAPAAVMRGSWGSSPPWWTLLVRPSPSPGTAVPAPTENEWLLLHQHLLLLGIPLPWQDRRQRLKQELWCCCPARTSIDALLILILLLILIVTIAAGAATVTSLTQRLPASAMMASLWTIAIIANTEQGPRLDLNPSVFSLLPFPFLYKLDSLLVPRTCFIYRVHILPFAPFFVIGRTIRKRRRSRSNHQGSRNRNHNHSQTTIAVTIAITTTNANTNTITTYGKYTTPISTPTTPSICTNCPSQLTNNSSSPN